MIAIDNGPEFVSQVVDQWAYETGVQLHFITPGRPMENGYIESFNIKFRDECLNENWFFDLADARRKIAIAILILANPQTDFKKPAVS
jgi:putative transposase